MSNHIIQEESLSVLCKKALTRAGMSNNDAEVVCNCLIESDKWGIHTHGCKNVGGYVAKAMAGGVSFTAQPTVESRSPSLAIVDGNNTLGFISANKAMNLACNLAEETGIGMTFVRNSCHFGAAGVYANIAARRGMIGLAFSNVDRRMAVPGSAGPVMGQNPMAWAIPAKSIPSIFFDIATSNVAGLKVVRAKNDGVKIPMDWIIDGQGNPTDDPSKYPQEGALLPMAGHKGYGIALMIEMLTSIVSGGVTSMSGQIPSWNMELAEPNNASHSFIAINYRKLLGKGIVEQRVEELMELVHNGPKAEGVDALYVPGERAWARYREAEKNGISVTQDELDDLLRLAERMEYTLEVIK